MSKQTPVSPADIAVFIEKYTGLHYPPGKEGQLKNNLDLLSKRLGFDVFDDFIASIDLNNPSNEIIAEIAKQLTIGETYFFREPQSFDALEKVVLPELIERKKNEKRLRIWSAACCSGEEVYSIAITVLQVLGSNAPGWKIEILGSDVNNEFLEAAAKGEYTRWSFRNTDPRNYGKYLFEENGKIKVSSELKKICRFEHLNLKTDEFPSIMNGTNYQDIIFCRNTFIYFNDELRSKIVNKFYNCLTNTGTFFLGLTELPYQTDPRFTQKSFGGSFYFAKGEKSLSAPAKHPKPSVEKKTPFAVPSEKKNPVLPPPVLNISASEISRKEAIKAYDEGNYANVVAYCEGVISAPGALKDNPSNVALARMLINSLANLGELKKAAEYCEKIIAYDKLDHISYFVYSNISLELGETEKAISLLKKTIFIEPGYLAAYFVLSNIFKRTESQIEYNRYSSSLLRMLENYKNDDAVEGLEGMLVSDVKFLLRQK